MSCTSIRSRAGFIAAAAILGLTLVFTAATVSKAETVHSGGAAMSQEWGHGGHRGGHGGYGGGHGGHCGW